MAGAVLGIYGNSKGRSALSGLFRRCGQASRSTARNRYTLRFAPGQLPPVNAFWSLDACTSCRRVLLYANPLNRYLINSPMLPDLKRDADGGITLYVQNESPGKEQGSQLAAGAEGAVLLGRCGSIGRSRQALRRQVEGAAAATRCN